MAEENTGSEQEVEPVEIDAPAQEETAAEQQEKQPERTFSQKELDEIVQKRIAKEQRKYEKLTAHYEAELAKASNAELKEQDKPIRREDFDDYEAYLEAKMQKSVELKLKEAEKERRANSAKFTAEQRQKEFNSKLESVLTSGRSKYSDFQEVVSGATDVPVSPTVAEAIVEADNGADIMYYLSKNPEVAEKLSEMSATLAAIEIGKLAVSLEAEAKPKKASSAPAPITPSTGRTPSNSTLPNDKDDIEAWMRKERERERARNRSR